MGKNRPVADTTPRRQRRRKCKAAVTGGRSRIARQRDLKQVKKGKRVATKERLPNNSKVNVCKNEKTSVQVLGKLNGRISRQSYSGTKTSTGKAFRNNINSSATINRKFKCDSEQKRDLCIWEWVPITDTKLCSRTSVTLHDVVTHTASVLGDGYANNLKFPKPMPLSKKKKFLCKVVSEISARGKCVSGEKPSVGHVDSVEIAGYVKPCPRSLKLKRNQKPLLKGKKAPNTRNSRHSFDIKVEDTSASCESGECILNGKELVCPALQNSTSQGNCADGSSEDHFNSEDVCASVDAKEDRNALRQEDSVPQQYGACPEGVEVAAFGTDTSGGTTPAVVNVQEHAPSITPEWSTLGARASRRFSVHKGDRLKVDARGHEQGGNACLPKRAKLETSLGIESQNTYPKGVDQSESVSSCLSGSTRESVRLCSPLPSSQVSSEEPVPSKKMLRKVPAGRFIHKKISGRYKQSVLSPECKEGINIDSPIPVSELSERSIMQLEEPVEKVDSSEICELKEQCVDSRRRRLKLSRKRSHVTSLVETENLQPSIPDKSVMEEEKKEDHFSDELKPSEVNAVVADGCVTKQEYELDSVKPDVAPSSAVPVSQTSVITVKSNKLPNDKVKYDKVGNNKVSSHGVKVPTFDSLSNSIVRHNKKRKLSSESNDTELKEVSNAVKESSESKGSKGIHNKHSPNKMEKSSSVQSKEKRKNGSSTVDFGNQTKSDNVRSKDGCVESPHHHSQSKSSITATVCSSKVKSPTNKVKADTPNNSVHKVEVSGKQNSGDKKICIPSVATKYAKKEDSPAVKKKHSQSVAIKRSKEASLVTDILFKPDTPKKVIISSSTSMLEECASPVPERILSSTGSVEKDVISRTPNTDQKHTPKEKISVEVPHITLTPVEKDNRSGVQESSSENKRSPTAGIKLGKSRNQAFLNDIIDKSSLDSVAARVRRSHNILKQDRLTTENSVNNLPQWNPENKDSSSDRMNFATAIGLAPVGNSENEEELDIDICSHVTKNIDHGKLSSEVREFPVRSHLNDSCKGVPISDGSTVRLLSGSIANGECELDDVLNEQVGLIAGANDRPDNSKKFKRSPLVRNRSSSASSSKVIFAPPKLDLQLPEALSSTSKTRSAFRKPEVTSASPLPSMTEKSKATRQLPALQRRDFKVIESQSRSLLSASTSKNIITAPPLQRPVNQAVESPAVNEVIFRVPTILPQPRKVQNGPCLSQGYSNERHIDDDDDDDADAISLFASSDIFGTEYGGGQECKATWRGKVKPPSFLKDSDDESEEEEEEEERVLETFQTTSCDGSMEIKTEDVDDVTGFSARTSVDKFATPVHDTKENDGVPFGISEEEVMPSDDDDEECFYTPAEVLAQPNEMSHDPILTRKELVQEIRIRQDLVRSKSLPVPSPGIPVQDKRGPKNQQGIQTGQESLKQLLGSSPVDLWEGPKSRPGLQIGIPAQVWPSPRSHSRSSTEVPAQVWQSPKSHSGSSTDQSWQGSKSQPRLSPVIPVNGWQASRSQSGMSPGIPGDVWQGPKSQQGSSSGIPGDVWQDPKIQPGSSSGILVDARQGPKSQPGLSPETQVEVWQVRKSQQGSSPKTPVTVWPSPKMQTQHKASNVEIPASGMQISIGTGSILTGVNEFRRKYCNDYMRLGRCNRQICGDVHMVPEFSESSRKEIKALLTEAFKMSFNYAFNEVLGRYLVEVDEDAKARHEKAQFSWLRQAWEWILSTLQECGMSCFGALNEMMRILCNKKDYVISNLTKRCIFELTALNDVVYETWHRVKLITNDYEGLTFTVWILEKYISACVSRKPPNLDFCRTVLNLFERLKLQCDSYVRVKPELVHKFCAVLESVGLSSNLINGSPVSRTPENSAGSSAVFSPPKKVHPRITTLETSEESVIYRTISQPTHLSNITASPSVKLPIGENSKDSGDLRNIVEARKKRRLQASIGSESSALDVQFSASDSSDGGGSIGGSNVHSGGPTTGVNVLSDVPDPISHSSVEVTTPSGHIMNHTATTPICLRPKLNRRSLPLLGVHHGDGSHEDDAADSTFVVPVRPGQQKHPPLLSQPSQPRLSQPSQRPQMQPSPQPVRPPQPLQRPQMHQSPQPVRLPQPSQRPQMHQSPQPVRLPQPSQRPQMHQSPQPVRLPQPSQRPQMHQSPQPVRLPQPSQRPQMHQSPQPARLPQPSQLPQTHKSSQPLLLSQPPQRPQTHQSPQPPLLPQPPHMWRQTTPRPQLRSPTLGNPPRHHAPFSRPTKEQRGKQVRPLSYALQIEQKLRSDLDTIRECLGRGDLVTVTRILEERRATPQSSEIARQAFQVLKDEVTKMTACFTNIVAAAVRRCSDKKMMECLGQIGVSSMLHLCGRGQWDDALTILNIMYNAQINPHIIMVENEGEQCSPARCTLGCCEVLMNNGYCVRAANILTDLGMLQPDPNAWLVDHRPGDDTIRNVLCKHVFQGMVVENVSAALNFFLKVYECQNHCGEPIDLKSGFNGMLVGLLNALRKEEALGVYRQFVSAVGRSDATLHTLLAVGRVEDTTLRALLAVAVDVGDMQYAGTIWRCLRLRGTYFQPVDQANSYVQVKSFWLKEEMYMTLLNHFNQLAAKFTLETLFSADADHFKVHLLVQDENITYDSSAPAMLTTNTLRKYAVDRVKNVLRYNFQPPIGFLLNPANHNTHVILTLNSVDVRTYLMSVLRC